MKLYDSGRAPNPRRVRIFLAEKGISGADRAGRPDGRRSNGPPEFTAINPLQRVPALVLDDGTVITESIAICRYFEALQPEPPLFGAARWRWRWSRCGTGGCELNLLAQRRACVSPLHPAAKTWKCRRCRPGPRPTSRGSLDFLTMLDEQLASIRSSPADVSRLPTSPAGRGRFHEAGQARGAGDARQCAALARRRVGAAEREGLTHAAHHRRLRRCVRLRRPFQHLLSARDREGDAAGRLRCVGARRR